MAVYTFFSHVALIIPFVPWDHTRSEYCKTHPAGSHDLSQPPVASGASPCGNTPFGAGSLCTGCWVRRKEKPTWFGSGFPCRASRWLWAPSMCPALPQSFPESLRPGSCLPIQAQPSFLILDFECCRLFWNFPSVKRETKDVVDKICQREILWQNNRIL